MRRVDVPEIGDLPSCPAWLRGAMTGYLHAMFDLLRPYDASVPVLVKALRHAESPEIVDLASGAGGPWPGLTHRLAAAGTPVTVTLTDLAPNDAAAARLASDPDVTYVGTPVSALAVPDELRGVRTMFTALHHFDAGEVRAILRDAQEAGVPFAAFEVTRRSGGGLLTTLALPILVLLLMPRVRPVRALPLLLTYLPPILPLLIWWDGMASMLRSHTSSEIRAIVDELRVPGYAWHVDEAPGPVPPLRILRVLGTPA